MATHREIHIRKLRVHNLKAIDLDLPLGKLVVLSGVSGSGKSSLAFDTLFAEGQRRYIETFSAYTRQFLERIDRPDADSIENIPPAVAIRQRNTSRSSRSTVGSITEINDYLRLLFAKIGRVLCAGCGQQIRIETAGSVTDFIERLPADTEYLITFPIAFAGPRTLRSVTAALQADGFVRIYSAGRIVNLNQSAGIRPPKGEPIRVIVDRLRARRTGRERILDSVETALAKGDGRCDLLLRTDDQTREIIRFSRHWRCEPCDRDYPEPQPRLYSFNHPLGACPECRGFGDVIDIDMDLVVPDKSKSIRDGAIAPWNSPAYEHELYELLDLADDYGIPVDVPYSKLSPRQLKLIREGVSERQFGGLRGFFRWLERKKYKMHIRVFLSRWRGYRTCPTCQGQRLSAHALATWVGEKNIAEISALEVSDAVRFFDTLDLTDHERTVAKVMLQQIQQRLGYLDQVGLRYLTLNRPARTLSGGEAQRVALTKALGAGLVNTLYVLDEPSIGLHQRDTHRLIAILHGLRDTRNSVVVVEHDEAILRAADELIDLGPGAGQAGGRIVYQGPLDQLDGASESVTAQFLQRKRSIRLPAQRRPRERGWIELSGARGNNLKDIQVAFPLGVLCVVSGVSGSGKSTLVRDTLYPALCQRLGKAGPKPAPHNDLCGAEQIRDCVLVDQGPIGRSSRSNPATYVKAFDEIRRALASSLEARIRNFGPGHFSFNVEGGRCTACEGQGVQLIDMQFLADVSITCPECAGLRYRKEILEVKYRGRNIAEVLDMSIQQAFAFFRGNRKIQKCLAPLLNVGLGYLRLGQPATTLSGGEAQRLKLAGHLAATKQKPTMLILDEPTTGLHPADILQLLDCFAALLGTGHSLLVVEHNMDVIKSADWIIDLGPEAAGDGGKVVGCGTPEQIAKRARSHTGRYLAEVLNG